MTVPGDRGDDGAVSDRMRPENDDDADDEPEHS